MEASTYQQAFALIEAMWQPLAAARPEKVIAPQDLTDWISRHIGASFPAEDDRARRVPYAFHSWNDYRRGDFDAYFWGTDAAVDEQLRRTSVPAGERVSLRQLTGPKLFDELCRMLSTTDADRIPSAPYVGDDAEGLWFYGFGNFLGARKGKNIQLDDQLCQRGIGPDGELVLRTRPLGELQVDKHDLAERLKKIGDEQNQRKNRTSAQAAEEAPRRDTPAQLLTKQRTVFLDYYEHHKPQDLGSALDERALWDYQYRVQRLRSIFRYRRLGADKKGRLALDEAVCLPYAIAREVEERLGHNAASNAMRNAILTARISTADSEQNIDASTPLFTPEETSRLATVCRWSQEPVGIAAAVTAAIARLILDDAKTMGQALIACLGGTVDAAFDNALKTYLFELAGWADALDMRDIPSASNATYNDLYVSPAFKHVSQGKRRAQTIGEVPDANPACIAAQAEGAVRLLIQAGSGMGKTTFVKGLAAGIAQMRLMHDGTLLNAIASHSHHVAGIEVFIPVLITQPRPDRAGKGFDLLKRDEPPTPEEFAEQLFYQLPPATFQDPFMAAAHDDEEAALAFFKQLLTSPRALVIVDSIDEVPLAVRDRYVECLDDLARAWNIRRLIITSRPLAAASEGALEDVVRNNVVQLLPLDSMRQLKLVTNLVRHYASPAQGASSPKSTTDQTALAKDLYERVSATPGFRSVLENPLVATALVRALIDAKNTTAYDALRTLTELLPKLPERDPYDDPVLAHLAYDLARSGTDSAGSVQEFTRRAVMCRSIIRSAVAGGEVPTEGGSKEDNQRLTEQLVDRMVTRRGILTIREGEVVFEHAVIQAFFAAQHVISTLQNDEVGENAADKLSDRVKERYQGLLSTSINTTGENAAFLAVLVLLSAHMHYAASPLDTLHNDLYLHLAVLVLDPDTAASQHDRAVALFSASHTFDFSAPCSRGDNVLLMESRLVELAPLVEAPRAGSESDGAVSLERPTDSRST